MGIKEPQVTRAHLISFRRSEPAAQHERSRVMADREGHRRFGNVRKLPSGRYQIRYPGPDGRLRTGPETYMRKGDADKALVLIEGQLASGNWADPERGKVRLGDYAAAWITERPGLRPRTMDLYRWLLGKHIEPHIEGVPAAPRRHDHRGRRRQDPPP